MMMGQSVPKRRHGKFRRRGITQKKAHNMDIPCVKILTACAVTGRRPEAYCPIANIYSLSAFHYILTH